SRQPECVLHKMLGRIYEWVRSHGPFRSLPDLPLVDVVDTRPIVGTIDVEVRHGPLNRRPVPHYEFHVAVEVLYLLARLPCPLDAHEPAVGVPYNFDPLLRRLIDCRLVNLRFDKGRDLY